MILRAEHGNGDRWILWKYIDPNNRERWRNKYQDPWQRHLCRWLKILICQLKIFVPWPWNWNAQEPILAFTMSSLLLKDFCENIWRNSFHTGFEFYGNFFSLKTCLQISTISFLSWRNWLIFVVLLIREPQEQELKNYRSIHFAWIVHAA